MHFILLSTRKEIVKLEEVFDCFLIRKFGAGTGWILRENVYNSKTATIGDKIQHTNISTDCSSVLRIKMQGILLKKA